MNPPFPKEISPSPLISSSIEVRFVSRLQDSELLDFFYRKYSANLPQVKGRPLPLPFDLKETEPQLKYWHDYILSNDTYSLSIGKNSIAFNFVKGYTLWNNYFQFITETLSAIFNSDRIIKIERVGVRYANIFQSQSRFEDLLDSKISLPFPVNAYRVNNERFVISIANGDILINLQAAENIRVVKNNQKLNGILLDIDAFQNTKLPINFNGDLLDIIDSLHSEVKTIFYYSLNEELTKQKFKLQF